VQIDTAKLSQISGFTVDAGLQVAGLAAVDAIRQKVYDERTVTNRLAKEKRATIAQLTQAMPSAPAGVTGSEDDIRKQVDDATAAKDAELERVRVKLEGIKADSQKHIDEIRASAQAQIDTIMAEQADLETKVARKREVVIQQHAAAVEPLNLALQSIRNNRENAARREQALATIAQLEGEADDQEQKSEQQTRALDGLDGYKLELLANLPIPGIEVRDGEIFRDGVQFDRLNTAQQVEIAVEIAKLRSGELGVICVDGLELLDADHYQAFRDAAVSSGLQLFVTRVAGEGFNIATDAPVVADPAPTVAPPKRTAAKAEKAARTPDPAAKPANALAVAGEAASSAFVDFDF